MFKRLIASILCLTFSLSNLQNVQAQDFSINLLPIPGTMLGESELFTPLSLKGVVVNLQNPLEFQFIVDTGKGPQDTASIKEDSKQLIKYFLAGLTIPEGDLWVNLSPYEKNRIVPATLGQTELGRDLLAQDYILKQLTASLIYPEKDLGKEFWNGVYAKAQAQFGTTNIPVNTFNKVWIMPDEAQVFENNNAAYVTKSTLKVMLDQDYLSMQKHTVVRNDMDSVGSNIVRQIILPEITKEVNTGKNFAPLRQIYQALILAKWYKQTIQNNLLDAIYTNQNKIAGVNLNDPTVKEQIYDRYLQAYKKGAFNYIKESLIPDGQNIPRKYFSGGANLAMLSVNHNGNASMIKKAVGALLLFTVLLFVPTTRASASAKEQPNTVQYNLPPYPAQIPSKSTNEKPADKKSANKKPTKEMLFQSHLEALSNADLGAIKWLGESGDRRAIYPLLELLENEKPNVTKSENGYYLVIRIDEALKKLGASRVQMAHLIDPYILLLNSFDSDDSNTFKITERLGDLANKGDKHVIKAIQKTRKKDPNLLEYDPAKTEALRKLGVNWLQSQNDFNQGLVELAAAIAIVVVIYTAWHIKRLRDYAMSPTPKQKDAAMNNMDRLKQIKEHLREVILSLSPNPDQWSQGQVDNMAMLSKQALDDLVLAFSDYKPMPQDERDFWNRVLPASMRYRPEAEEIQKIEKDYPLLRRLIVNLDINWSYKIDFADKWAKRIYIFSAAVFLTFVLTEFSTKGNLPVWGHLTGLFLSLAPSLLTLRASKNLSSDIHGYIKRTNDELERLKREKEIDEALYDQIKAVVNQAMMVDNDKLKDRASVSLGKSKIDNGGIDFNQISVSRTGKTFKVKFDPAQLNQLIQGGFKGFSFRIESMTRISSPFPLLGVNMPKH